MREFNFPNEGWRLAMRTVPAELARRYEAAGWWTAETIGDLLAAGLAAAPGTPFRVHSAVRPWRGTFGDVEIVARRLAGGLRERGVRVGHFMGMLNAFLIPVLDGTPVNLTDVWDPARALALMDSDGLCIGGGAAYYITSLLDHPDFTPAHLKNMKYAGLGGAPVPAAVTTRLESLGITVFRSYGSTEHPSITGSRHTAPPDKRMYTDGDVLPGAEIRLTADGEILSRGSDLCLGYTDEALTARAFDAEGWYRTGDIGVLDADGYLTITDRKSDVIIRGGENISALEVEELLLAMDGVAEVAVVAAPDPRLGERAAAVLRMRAGHPAPDLGQVRAHLEQAGLARQKWPEELLAVDDFPRTASGKVRKYLLRKDLAARRATAPSTASPA